jgi:hypothetical protein
VCMTLFVFRPCAEVYLWIVEGQWSSPGTLVSSKNTANWHDIYIE